MGYSRAMKQLKRGEIKMSTGSKKKSGMMPICKTVVMGKRK